MEMKKIGMAKAAYGLNFFLKEIDRSAQGLRPYIQTFRFYIPLGLP
jgi:hypothetical protein